MKYITLIASETVNGSKVEVGKQDQFPIAETIQDVLAMENEDHGWNSEEIVACFNYGSRVKRQTTLRAEAKTPPSANVKLFKNLSQEKQEEILKQHGLL